MNEPVTEVEKTPKEIEDNVRPSIGEVNALLKKIEGNPAHLGELKKSLLMGILLLLGQDDAQIAEDVAKLFSQFVVYKLKERGYDTADKLLSDVLKKTLLLHKKDQAFFKETLPKILLVTYQVTNFFDVVLELQDKLLNKVRCDDKKKKKFMEKYKININKLRTFVTMNISRSKFAIDKSKSSLSPLAAGILRNNEEVKAFVNNVKNNVPMTFLFFLFVFGGCVFLGYTVGVAFYTAAVVGNLVVFGKIYMDANKRAKKMEESACENVKLELAKPDQPPSHRKGTCRHEKKPTQSIVEPVLYLMITPVSYTPLLTEEKPVDPVAENKKPFAWKGRHDNKSKPDTRPPEKKERESMLALTTSNSSAVESPQEAVVADENPKRELSPADFDYRELKQKYLAYIQGAGYFIFDKHTIKKQALKCGHENQYKILRKAFVDKTQQRMARDEGQGGHLKLANEAGYEFKTTHGPYRGIFTNSEKNIAKTQEGKYKKVYKAKVYNEYSSTGLHKKS